MQSPDEFMREFFRARTAEIGSELGSWKGFGASFYSSDCQWDNRAFAVSRSKSEEIVSVSSSRLEAKVVTQPVKPFPRLRYHLGREAETWMISRVEMECAACRNQLERVRCSNCNGTGWVGTQD